MKNFLLGILSILIAVMFLAVGGEIALRAYQLFAGYMDPEKVMGVITLDDELGWLPTANYSFSGQLKDSEGRPYDADIRIDSAGYRMFGDPRTTSRKKVLFIGDSFTQAMHVSDNRTYPALMSENLDIEVFSFGVEGFGTLQEYMLLERIIDDIGPDVVVLQFCPNDFINNSYELELRAVENNNRLRRPYFSEEGITYRTPSSNSAIREFAAKYSRFLYLVLSRIDILRANPAASSSAESSEALIEKEGMAYPLFQQAVQVTEQLLKKIRMRVPATTPVYLFSTHHGEPYYEQIERIANSAGMIFIDGPPQAVSAAQRQGISTLAADRGHWNNGGHQIVADALQRYFLETGQFRRRDTIPEP